MAKKKQKIHRIPSNLVLTEIFEFTFPSTSPEEYITHLEQSLLDRLTLATEDSNLGRSGHASHTSFAFRRWTWIGYVWVLGTIYAIDTEGMLVAGKIGMKRGDIVFFAFLPGAVFLLNFYWLISLRISLAEFVLNLLFFGLIFLVVYAINFVLVRSIRKSLVRLLGK
jgi:hypothetical protein